MHQVLVHAGSIPANMSICGTKAGAVQSSVKLCCECNILVNCWAGSRHRYRWNHMHICSLCFESSKYHKPAQVTSYSGLNHVSYCCSFIIVWLAWLESACVCKNMIQQGFTKQLLHNKFPHSSEVSSSWCCCFILFWLVGIAITIHAPEWNASVIYQAEVQKKFYNQYSRHAALLLLLFHSGCFILCMYCLVGRNI